MIIIAERINSTRKSIQEALSKNDFEFIRKEAKQQAEAGAAYIDLNCAAVLGREIELIGKLVPMIQKETNLPICLDSPDPAALEKGLSVHQGEAMVNSITAEKERMEAIAPLVKKYHARVICLLMDEQGMPKTCSERVAIAKKVLRDLEKYEIAADRVYFDALLRPVSTEPEQVKEFLEAVRIIMKDFGCHTTCGLSNVSFGLPQRSLINATFAAMACAGGLDSAILDPLDEKLAVALKTSDALLGKDEYCMNFIQYFREKK